MYEKVFININDSKQGMFLQCNNTDNPVLLFLHGGPGSPEVAMNAKWSSGLENMFTVCWWEQRGSGISFNKRIKAKEMTIDQMILDTVSIVEYLKKKFNKEKIYIMGHSWGSFLGIQTVHKYPNLFHAYIGTGQVKKTSESEFLAYNHLLEIYKKQDNKKIVSKFEKYNVTEDSKCDFGYVSSIRTKYLDKNGIGIAHENITTKKAIKAIVTFKGYNLIQKINFLRGSLFSLKNLFPIIYNIDLSEKFTEFEIPIYILQGKYDYQTSYKLAKDYYEIIKAPVKGFYSFHNSAHSPCFEESSRMQEILLNDVLKNKTSLSDYM